MSSALYSRVPGTRCPIRDTAADLLRGTCAALYVDRCSDIVLRGFDVLSVVDKMVSNIAFLPSIPHPPPPPWHGIPRACGAAIECQISKIVSVYQISKFDYFVLEIEIPWYQVVIYFPFSGTRNRIDHVSVSLNTHAQNGRRETASRCVYEECQRGIDGKPACHHTSNFARTTFLIDAGVLDTNGENQMWVLFGLVLGPVHYGPR